MVFAAIESELLSSIVRALRHWQLCPLHLPWSCSCWVGHSSPLVLEVHGQRLFVKLEVRQMIPCSLPTIHHLIGRHAKQPSLLTSDSGNPRFRGVLPGTFAATVPASIYWWLLMYQQQEPPLVIAFKRKHSHRATGADVVQTRRCRFCHCLLLTPCIQLAIPCCLLTHVLHVSGSGLGGVASDWAGPGGPGGAKPGLSHGQTGAQQAHRARPGTTPYCAVGFPPPGKVRRSGKCRGRDESGSRRSRPVSRRRCRNQPGEGSGPRDTRFTIDAGGCPWRIVQLLPPGLNKDTRSARRMG